MRHQSTLSFGFGYANVLHGSPSVLGLPGATIWEIEVRYPFPRIVPPPQAHGRTGRDGGVVAQGDLVISHPFLREGYASGEFELFVLRSDVISLDAARSEVIRTGWRGAQHARSGRSAQTGFETRSFWYWSLGGACRKLGIEGMWINVCGGCGCYLLKDGSYVFGVKGCCRWRRSVGRPGAKKRAVAVAIFGSIEQ